MRNDDVPTPQAHIQNILDSMATSVAVVTAGTAAGAAAWMANLDAISKVLAIIATALNIAWIIAQWWWRKSRE